MSISEVLSNDEVDVLLSKLEEENDSSTKECRDIDPYDFSKSSQRHLYGLAKLELINEIFCREASESISHFICQRINVESSNPQIIPFNEYIKSLGKPVLINYIMVKPLSAIFLMGFSNELVSRSIELLLGGDVKNSIPENRIFGKTESNICRLMIEIFNKNLAKAWTTITPLEFTYIKSMTNLNLVNFIESNENVIVIKYNLIISETHSEFTLCIPVESLKPIKNLLNHDTLDGVSDEDPELEIGKSTLKSNVQQTSLTITGVLAETKINVAELLKLEVGDIVYIEHPKCCHAMAGGVKIFKARPGIHNHARALQIEDFIDEN